MSVAGETVPPVIVGSEHFVGSPSSSKWVSMELAIRLISNKEVKDSFSKSEALNDICMHR